jgi:glycopeptide antibiotics resistance protein
LYIPATYRVVDKMILEPPWSEFEMSGNYCAAVLKNIMNFMPLGFCFCAYFSADPRISPPRLTTVIAGPLVSLTIEILQGFLPTRDSRMTDTITNTLGAWGGAALYAALWLTLPLSFE